MHAKRHRRPMRRGRSETSRRNSDHRSQADFWLLQTAGQRSHTELSSLLFRQQGPRHWWTARQWRPWEQQRPHHQLFLEDIHNAFSRLTHVLTIHRVFKDLEELFEWCSTMTLAIVAFKSQPRFIACLLFFLPFLVEGKTAVRFSG
ncbi:hypothetical protein AVEN_242801-1 [Araneus ventricosus]|uniref:Uncharacterized protein n=1 Tax=Araneus ventricosus TaxID=182803 RepID=A0A4Y2S592_ARAVE|nr:hypothetical protein AVEN_242801-1 [Araneus ventricosus]